MNGIIITDNIQASKNDAKVQKERQNAEERIMKLLDQLPKRSSGFWTNRNNEDNVKDKLIAELKKLGDAFELEKHILMDNVEYQRERNTSLQNMQEKNE